MRDSPHVSLGVTPCPLRPCGPAPASDPLDTLAHPFDTPVEDEHPATDSPASGGAERAESGRRIRPRPEPTPPGRPQAQAAHARAAWTLARTNTPQPGTAGPCPRCTANVGPGPRPSAATGRPRRPRGRPCAPVRPRLPAPTDRRPLGQRSRAPLPAGPCDRRPRVNGGAAGRETDEPIGLQPAVRPAPIRLVLAWHPARRRPSLYPLGRQWLAGGPDVERLPKAPLLRATRGRARGQNAAPALLPLPLGRRCSGRVCACQRTRGCHVRAPRGQACPRDAAT